MHEINETLRIGTSGEKWLTVAKPQAIFEEEKYSVSKKIYTTENIFKGRKKCRIRTGNQGI